MLIDRLKQDHCAARVAKDEVLSALLGTLIGTAETQAKAKENRAPRDEEVTTVLRSYTKGARETADAYRARGDEAGLAKMEREISVMASYLSAQPTSEAVREAAASFKSSTPDANVGAVMAHLKSVFGAGLDGKAASEIVRSL